MRHQLELAYLGIEVPDPASLTPFFADVVGLVPGEPGPPGAVTWRNDDKAQRVIVEPGPADDAGYVGLEAVDEDAFDAVAQRLAAAGFPVREGPDDERASRRVRRFAHTMAPWGVRVELVEGLEDASAAYSSPLVPGGFLTRGVGFGHTVFATTAFEESHAFATEGLGWSSRTGWRRTSPRASSWRCASTTATRATTTGTRTSCRPSAALTSGSGPRSAPRSARAAGLGEATRRCGTWRRCRRAPAS
jgi:catechol 2,3-dioxygenase-like lactoylglutathione lyase family enzyme